MKIIGQILLWAGFLSGALATVYYAPKSGVEFVKSLTPDSKQVTDFNLPDMTGVVVPQEGWHLIPWAWYLVSVAIAVAGIVALRIGKSAQGQKSEKTSASLAEIKTSLNQLISNVGKLSKDVDELAPSKIVHRIDDVLADDLRTFAEGRDSITAEFGLSVFADVMTQFAAGERAINRAWSAAADGYVDEAATCIERADKMFQEANRILNSA